MAQDDVIESNYPNTIIPGGHSFGSTLLFVMGSKLEAGRTVSEVEALKPRISG